MLSRSCIRYQCQTTKKEDPHSGIVENEARRSIDRGCTSVSNRVRFLTSMQLESFKLGFSRRFSQLGVKESWSTASSLMKQVSRHFALMVYLDGRGQDEVRGEEISICDIKAYVYKGV